MKQFTRSLLQIWNDESLESIMVKILVPDFKKYLDLDISLKMRENQLVLCVIDGLLQGRKNTQEWQQLYVELCGNHSCTGTYLSQNSDSDEMLLEQILKNCDQDMPATVVEKYGSASKLGMRSIELCQEREKSEIGKALEEQHESCYQLLVKEMKRKGYETDADYYNALRFSRQTFSRLRSKEYMLSRENALWLTLGLEPNYWGGSELLNAAGYSLRSANRREYIIAYVMKSGPYTLLELNNLLDFYGEKPIGCE